MKAPVRVKIAAVLLVLICLVSIYEPIHLRSLRVSRFSDIMVGLERASCLSGALPRDVHTYGFLPPVPAGTDLPPQSLLLMRYAVAPDLISGSPQGAWVIANYPDRESALPELQRSGLTVVKDCGNGIFLLKR
jgi:hypothetical protein